MHHTCTCGICTDWEGRGKLQWGRAGESPMQSPLQSITSLLTPLALHNSPLPYTHYNVISRDYCHTTLHTFECSLCSAHALHPASSGPAVPHPLLCGQCAGLLYNPFFFSLHLLDLVWSSSSLQNVLKSVMLNYKQVGQEGTMHKYVHVGYALGKLHGNPPPLLLSITSLLLYNIM